MGKLNKKLVKNPIIKSAEEKLSNVKGPFPIYRTIPVPLNGPEPSKFKIERKAAEKKSKPKSLAPEALPEKQQEDEKSVSKLKKLKSAGIQKRLSKKEKQKMKKVEVLKKIDLTQKAFQEDKARKKREKTIITGDLKPLLDSLPSLESLFKLKTTKAIKTGVPKYDKKIVPKTKKQKKIDRVKKNTKEFLDRYHKVKQVMKDKKFKKNPRAAIAAHLRRREIPTTIQS